MMKKYFPGRIIIDHLEKTGGQALTAWLAEELGIGCVSPNLIGFHRDLIKSSSGYSIIVSHIDFLQNEELDSRYQYITCLRDPIDRMVSWLFFMLHDVKTEHSRSRIEAARTFVESDGKECSSELLSHYCNRYVRHFSSIGSPETAATQTGSTPEENRLAAALAAIRQYDVIGFYEDFPVFIEDVANLVGIAAPASVGRVNVSSRRPRVDEISAALRQRIIELNQEDVRFYSEVLKWKKEQTPRVSVSDSKSGWQKYDPNEVLLTHPVGSLSAINPAPSLITNEQKVFRVIAGNRSRQSWGATPPFPVRASYHWLRSSGGIYLYDGHRTPLPLEGIPAGKAVPIDMTVVAPREAGCYTLVLTLLQEGFSWLEKRGFEPAIVQIVVKDPEYRESYIVNTI
jgi:hypothetical protein